MPNLDLSAERIEAISAALNYYADHFPESFEGLSALQLLVDISRQKTSLNEKDLRTLGIALYFYRDNGDQEFDDLDTSEQKTFLANRKIVNSILRDMRHAFET